MRLIDADKLLADYGMGSVCSECRQDTRECEYERRYTMMDLCVMVDLAPTVDAVPVVRCRDCANAYEHRGDWYCFALPSETGLTPDAFCDRGTRRDKEERK